MRLWMSKIYDEKTRDVMVAAMHKRTKIGCEKLIQEAIDNCTVSSVQNYIKRNYMKNTEREIKTLTSSKYGLSCFSKLCYPCRSSNKKIIEIFMSKKKLS
ncbi:hypothetical protein RhiirC2_805484 [Rhizophagus irregularis]|uniref:Uncharacterized protein n=1 Tax=Rhizophagus irregularis TaxID=588596 RepID=A0A2N1KU62_9GLOM|nr:hypothetical protein RhiirC2_805484 [Rhizophagus irregularis]